MNPSQRFPIRLLAILSLAVCLCPVLYALPIRVLPWDQEIASMKLALVDSKGSTEIKTMHPSKRCGPYQITIGEKPPTLRNLQKKDAEGKPCEVPIAFPKGLKQPLLIILPDAKSDAGVRAFIIEDDSSAFAWGSTRFINSTGKKLVFVSEKKGVNLPASWTPVDVSPPGETRNLEVKLFFRDDLKRAVYSAVWEHNTDQRKLVFLVKGEDPRLGPVGLKMIVEDRRVAKALKDTTAGQP